MGTTLLLLSALAAEPSWLQTLLSVWPLVVAAITSIVWLIRMESRLKNVEADVVEIDKRTDAHAENITDLRTQMKTMDLRLENIERTVSQIVQETKAISTEVTKLATKMETYFTHKQ